MYSYAEFKRMVKAQNKTLEDALLQQDLPKLEKLLHSHETIPFTTGIVKIETSEDQQELSIETVIEGETYKKIIEMIKTALNKAMVQRSFDSILNDTRNIIVPLKSKLSKRLQRARLIQLIGMEFPYYIEIMPPHSSLTIFALDHYCKETFRCILESPHMNAVNLVEPGKRDSPLIHAIDKKNPEAIEMILSSPHLTMTLLRKNKNTLENTALGRAIITGQTQIVEMLLKKAHALYREVYAIDFKERPVAVSLFYQDGHKNSALSLAAVNGKTAIIKKLLAMGGSLFKNYPTYIINALNAAIDARQHKSVSLLINTDLYPATQRELLKITRKAHPELKKYVLRTIDIGCNHCLDTFMNSEFFQEHCINNMSDNFLFLKTVETGNKSLVQTFLEHPYLQNRQEETFAQRYIDTHYNALHLAVLNEFTEIVEYLAKYYPPLMLQQDIQFQTPLHYATRSNNLSLLKAMINEKTINQEVARLISAILQHPNKDIQPETIDFLRDKLISYDRQ